MVNTTPMHAKILLVDDNEDLMKITQLILKSQGHESVMATSVEEAERKIRIYKPSLILLDICLPLEDGIAFCRRLKNNMVTRFIRVLLMSGKDVTQTEIKAADGFLPKPFDFNELTRKVAQQLLAARNYAARVAFN